MFGYYFNPSVYPTIQTPTDARNITNATIWLPQGERFPFSVGNPTLNKYQRKTGKPNFLGKMLITLWKEYIRIYKYISNFEKNRNYGKLHEQPSKSQRHHNHPSIIS